MNAVSLRTAACDGVSVGQGFSWRDPDIDCTLVISHPSADPGLWSAYSAGAYRSFRKHGVEAALDMEALRSGTDTIMFFAVVDDDGEEVAGCGPRDRCGSPTIPMRSLNGTGTPASRPSGT